MTQLEDQIDLLNEQIEDTHIRHGRAVLALASERDRAIVLAGYEERAKAFWFDQAHRNEESADAARQEVIRLDRLVRETRREAEGARSALATAERMIATLTEERDRWAAEAQALEPRRAEIAVALGALPGTPWGILIGGAKARSDAFEKLTAAEADRDRLAADMRNMADDFHVRAGKARELQRRAFQAGQDDAGNRHGDRAAIFEDAERDLRAALTPSPAARCPKREYDCGDPACDTHHAQCSKDTGECWHDESTCKDGSGFVAAPTEPTPPPKCGRLMPKGRTLRACVLDQGHAPTNPWCHDGEYTWLFSQSLAPPAQQDSPETPRPTEMVDVDVMRCKDCGNEGTEFYYDTNPDNLPPLRTKDGQPARCLMGAVVTGEPGAERCMKCESRNIEFTGKTTPVPAEGGTVAELTRSLALMRAAEAKTGEYWQETMRRIGIAAGGPPAPGVAMEAFVRAVRIDLDATKDLLPSVTAPASPIFTYRPGLPSIEKIRAHETNGGWWLGFFSKTGAKTPIRPPTALLIRVIDLDSALLPDWARSQWARFRPCLPDGTPTAWPDEASHTAPPPVEPVDCGTLAACLAAVEAILHAFDVRSNPTGWGVSLAPSQHRALLQLKRIVDATPPPALPPVQREGK